MREQSPVATLQAYVARYASQREAAAALEVSPSYLSDLLNGRREFSGVVLERLGLRRVVIAADERPA